MSKKSRTRAETYRVLELKHLRSKALMKEAFGDEADAAKNHYSAELEKAIEYDTDMCACETCVTVKLCFTMGWAED